MFNVIIIILFVVNLLLIKVSVINLIGNKVLFRKLLKFFYFVGVVLVI